MSLMFYQVTNKNMLAISSVENIDNISIVKRQQEESNISLVSSILEHTQCEFEKIVNYTNEPIIIEALARPQPAKMNLSVGENDNADKVALVTLLKIVEDTRLTFMLFQHMLTQIEVYLGLYNDAGVKFSINAYSDDIENQNFLKVIEECSFASRLIIELTEKKTWSNQSIKNLKKAQLQYGIEIAMDDINPTVSNNNYSMQNLEKLKNNNCYVNIGKIDGLFFQELAEKNDYKSLCDRIIFDNKHYKICHFIIEWIETSEQNKFAKKLQETFPFFTFGYQGYYYREN